MAHARRFSGDLEAQFARLGVERLAVQRIGRRLLHGLAGHGIGVFAAHQQGMGRLVGAGVALGDQRLDLGAQAGGVAGVQVGLAAQFLDFRPQFLVFLAQAFEPRRAVRSVRIRWRSWAGSCLKKGAQKRTAGLLGSPASRRSFTRATGRGV
ncbi:MAG: hypothetical protein NVV74_05200 [Magnetospirillum sp.]|nr:hypothetical protein [Magnetospirillum sp.]